MTFRNGQNGEGFAPTEGGAARHRPLEVTVGDRGVEGALRLFKRLVLRDGILREVKRHAHYEKPGDRRRRKIREAARRLIDQVGLTPFARAYPHQLSEGMRQRVALARAFCADPDLLLLDEPFASIDEQNRLLLQDELLAIWQATRKTVLFVTHSIDEAIALADRVLVMTARPARIKGDFAVPFARPRSVQVLRHRPEFARLAGAVWEILREEVLLARARETAAVP